MKRTKVLSVVLALVLCFGMLTPTAFAIGEIITEDPDGVDFSTTLELGVPFEGEILEDDPYIEVTFPDEDTWSGYAKGFSVNLTENTDYTVKVHVECDDANYVDRAIAVYYGEQLGYWETNSDRANSVDVAVSFPFFKPGEYHILVWGFCDNGDVALYDNTKISVIIDRAANLPAYTPDFDLVINPGETQTVMFDEDDHYYEMSDYYGEGVGFTTNLTAGKFYTINVDYTLSQAVIDGGDYGVWPALAAYQDGYFEFCDGTSGSLTYTFRAGSTGEHKYLFFAEAYDRISSTYLYSADVSYDVSVQELSTAYFDIDCEEDYIEFIDDIYFRNYEGCAVIATIYGDLDFTDNDLYHSIETNANVLSIEGVGETVINGISDSLVSYNERVYLENITVYGDIVFDGETTNSVYLFGFLVGNANSANIKNCNAYGSISFDGVQYIYEVGGLVGRSDNLYIENAEVELNITDNGSDDFEVVGGIVGYVEDILDASNVNSTVNITSDATNYFDNVGGFVGCCDYYGVFENCTAEGTIECESSGDICYIGGFAGYLEDYNTFINCGAKVEINALYGNCVGGFAGYIDEENVFYNCYAEGDIVGYGHVGGFVGVSNCCGYNRFVNCYSIGFINAYDYIGGFIGETYDEDAFYNCYAYSDIVCAMSNPADAYVGTFAGYVGADNTFSNIFAQEDVHFEPMGYLYDEATDLSYVYTIDFDKKADEIAASLNEFVESPSIYAEYELLNWTDDTEDGLPRFAEPVQYLLGDANCDGSITSADYTLVKRACFNTYTFESAALLAADANGDGNITSADYSLIKRICFGTYIVE